MKAHIAQPLNCYAGRKVGDAWCRHGVRDWKLCKAGRIWQHPTPLCSIIACKRSGCVWCPGCMSCTSGDCSQVVHPPALLASAAHARSVRHRPRPSGDICIGLDNLMVLHRLFVVGHLGHHWLLEDFIVCCD